MVKSGWNPDLQNAKMGYMPAYHRYYFPNAQVFITTVTFQRHPIFREEANINLFWQVLRKVQEIHPFHLTAYVILPDHFHWIMQMPEEQPNFSRVLHSVKRNFTREYQHLYGIEHSLQLWQARFWDHVIRDENDLSNHMDYIHYNPVKHGLAHDPANWEQSSYRFWLKKGLYGDWIDRNMDIPGAEM
jgi:putative transposase